PSPLADCYVGERNSSQRSQGGDQHAPIGATSDDGIAPEAAEAPAGRATYQEDRACRQVCIAQIEAVDSLEKCRKKSGKCVEVEVDKNSRRNDPPESGHTEQLPNRTLGPRRMALSSSAFRLAKQKYYRGQEQSRNRGHDHGSSPPECLGDRPAEDETEPAAHGNAKHEQGQRLGTALGREKIADPTGGCRRTRSFAHTQAQAGNNKHGKIGGPGGEAGQRSPQGHAAG